MTFTQPYGVTIGSGSASGSLNASAITDMNNLGVTWLRYQVNWSLIDATGTANQNPATYTWGAYDSAVSQCNAAGINILLSVMKPPSQFATSSNPLKPSAAATFASQIASRYNGGSHGTVQGIELNEDYNYGSDNLSVPDPDVTALVATMKAVYPAVKAVNSSMLCGIPCKLQRNSLGYTDWFETLLNPTTGAYIGGVFQGDWLNFHYYTVGPLSGGVPVSLDPTVDVPSWNGGNGIPSITHAWQIIHSKMSQYSVSLPVYLTEFGPYINTNPGRNSAGVVSQSTQWQYYKGILDSCSGSGVVARVFFFTLGYYTGYAAPNYRDGCSLVQGTSGSPIYTTAYTNLKTYIANKPSWGSGGTGGALTSLPAALSFSAIAGGASPATQSVTVTNSDSSSASYSASDDASWLSVSPTSGTIASGGHATATVSVNSTGLVVGTYTGTITWTAGALSDSTTVTLTVSSSSPPPAVTPLTAYFPSAASPLIPTANQVYTTLGTPSVVNITNALGTATGWGEIVVQGTTAPWAAASSIGGPSGYGFLWGARALENNDLQPGTYTAAIRLNMVGAGAVSITADIHCGAFKWNATTGYTAIGDGGLTGQTITTTKTVFAPTFTTTLPTSFGTGDKLYLHIKIKVLTNTGPSTASIQLNDLSTDTTTFTGSSTAGVTTPGYAPTPAGGTGGGTGSKLLPGQILHNGVSNFLYGTQQTVDFGNPHTVINTAAIQSQIKSAGLTVMRLPVSSGSTTYSDSVIDARLAACTACGAAPLIILGHDAGFAYAQHVVSYVGNRCLLYEFFNEPDLNVNINGWQDYLATWNSWIPTLRSLNSQAAFGGPALGVVASFSSYLQPWLAGTVSSGILPDFVSFHDYPCGSQPSSTVCATNAGNFFNDADALRTILKSVLGTTKGNAMPIAITEWNIDWHNPPVSYANQANSANNTYINTWYTNALSAMSQAGVALACQFDCADGAESGQADLISTTSPYPVQGGYQALADAVAAWQALPPSPPPPAPPPPGSPPGLSVANGRIVDSSGKTVVLRGLNTAGLEFGDGLGSFTQARINAFTSLFSMNLWRLAVNVSWWNSNAFLSDGKTPYQSWVRQVIGWMETAGCYVEIDPTTYVTVPPANSGPYCDTLQKVASDTFTRANQTNWGTASDGHVWNSSAGTAITSNAGVVTGSQEYFAVPQSFTALGDLDVVAVLSPSNVTANNDEIGVMVRYIDNNNFYRLRANQFGYQLEKRVAGTLTTLAFATNPVTTNAPYAMRLLASGTSLSARTWLASTSEPGTWDLTATDNSLSSGAPGIYAFAKTGDTITVSVFSTITSVTACITAQDTQNFPPWTDSQITSATNTFYDSFIPLYQNDARLLYDACNEPAFVPVVADPVTVSNAIIAHIKSLQPQALIFVYGHHTDSAFASSASDPYPGTNLVWDYHLYDDPSWLWQDKLIYWQSVWNWGHSLGHAITVGEWNVNTTNDPGGFATAIANLVLTQNVATTYYNADDLLLGDNVTLTTQGQLVQAAYRTIAGGAPATSGTLSLTINAVPFPIDGTSLVAKSMVGRQGELSVRVLDVMGASHIQQWQQVALYNPSGALAFSGYVSEPEEWKPGFSPLLVTQFTAMDQRFLAKKRVIAKLYRNQTTDFMANDIYTNILAAEGVTIGQIAISGVTVPIANFGYVSVDAALDAIVVAASSSGNPYYWTIDQSLALWVVPYATVTGPTIDGTQIDDGRLSGVMPKVKRANPLYRNTQYAVGGVQETASNDETRAGDGQTRTFTFRYPLNAAPSIFTLNGASKSLGVKGQTGFNYYYAVGDNTIAQDDSQTILVSTDRLRMVYVGQESAVFQVQNTGAVATQRDRDGSTGIVEAVLNDSTIASHAQGTALVGQQITRYCQNATRFTFATQASGLVPGQVSNVNYTPYGFANTQMLIEEVDLSDGQDGVMLWYTITAVQGPYDTTWAEFFGNLFKPPGFQLASNISLGIALNTPLLPATTLFPSPTLYPQS